MLGGATQYVGKPGLRIGPALFGAQLREPEQKLCSARNPGATIRF